MRAHPSIADTDALADRLHATASNKYGNQPYMIHPRAVAQLVHPYGPEAVQAALLHDTVEDTAYTLEQMRTDGYPDLVVNTVDAVTRRPGETYAVFIQRASLHWLGRIIKLADNHHNYSSLDQAEDQIWASGMKRRYTRAKMVLERALVLDVARRDGFTDVGGIRVSPMDTAESHMLWLAIGHHNPAAVQTACEERARQLGWPTITGDPEWTGRTTTNHGHGILTGLPDNWAILTMAPDHNGIHRPITDDTIGAFKVSWIENYLPLTPTPGERAAR